MSSVCSGYGTRLIPHGWNEAVGLCPSDTDLIEYLVDSPYIDEIAVGGWSLDEDGMLAISDAPDLGLELDMDTLARYAGGETLLPLIQ